MHSIYSTGNLLALLGALSITLTGCPDADSNGQISPDDATATVSSGGDDDTTSGGDDDDDTGSGGDDDDDTGGGGDDDDTGGGGDDDDTGSGGDDDDTGSGGDDDDTGGGGDDDDTGGGGDDDDTGGGGDDDDTGGGGDDDDTGGGGDDDDTGGGGDDDDTGGGGDDDDTGGGGDDDDTGGGGDDDDTGGGGDDDDDTGGGGDDDDDTGGGGDDDDDTGGGGDDDDDTGGGGDDDDTGGGGDDDDTGGGGDDDDTGGGGDDDDTGGGGDDDDDTGGVDEDGDGFSPPEDCDDQDPYTYPGADEYCDNVDNDCDGQVDEGTSEDSDGDGILDCLDECPSDPDNDADGDEYCGDYDNCPTDTNPDQEDWDADGLGDLCDPCPFDPYNDEDADGVCDLTDNCFDLYNPDQTDSDGDGAGDACDPCPLDEDDDPDGDGVCSEVDNCPRYYNPEQGDSDNDGTGDICDVETCDGLDNDGDGGIDETFPDEDGSGGADCFDNDGDGVTEQQGDCNDEDPETYPDAPEDWYDGIDSNCDGEDNPSSCEDPPPPQEVEALPGCDTDLTVTVLDYCEGDCDTRLSVVVEVSNHSAGNTPPGLPMAVYSVTGEGIFVLQEVLSLDAIPAYSTSGGLILGPFDYTSLTYFPSLVVAVDDDGSGQSLVSECDEDNNRAAAYLDGFDCEAPLACDEPPPAHPVTSDASCVYYPPIGEFTPGVEWQKSTFVTQPTFNQVMMTPVVGNLTDDNGDGRIDEADMPDIVFTTFSPQTGYTAAGYLRAVSGDDAREIFTVEGVSGSGGVAIGDASGDGIPEVYSVDLTGQLQAFSNTGVPLWTCASVGDRYSFPAIADVEGDGDGEILLGRSVCSHTGTRLVTATLAHDLRTPFFQDVDQDGTMEIVSGAGISRLDGTTVWSGSGGYGAMANFDADSRPELIAVAGGAVTLRDDSGAVLWSVPLPGGGGGPPTIADFDADGQPEVGVAGRSVYFVIETDGSVKWQNTTQDYSSSITGSSVYDFDGDGQAEVVYADEITLWIYDGATGDVLLAEDGHANGTLWEYPVLADVDRDGHVEIVLASNNYTFSGWTGITVLGDVNNNWVTGRPVWNQHAYHITNINDDLSIPTRQVANWVEGNNTFRQGGYGSRGAFAAPDLTPLLVDTCTTQCPLEVEILFQVENRGVNTVEAGLPWAVFGEVAEGELEELVATGTVPEAIDPGWSSETQSVTLEVAGLAGYGRIFLAVDSDGTGQGVQNECNEGNNFMELEFLCE